MPYLAVSPAVHVHHSPYPASNIAVAYLLHGKPASGDELVEIKALRVVVHVASLLRPAGCI